MGNTRDTLCDVGPMPWGDGTVDVEGLKVFISYWELERNLINLSETTFDRIVLGSQGPVLVDF